MTASLGNNLELNFYAELLPNIGQITIYASQHPLSEPGSPKDKPAADSEAPHSTASRLTLSESRASICISYLDRDRTLSLPATAAESALRALSDSQQSSWRKDHEFSVRLQIDDSDPAAIRAPAQHDVPIPWSAKYLGPNSRIRCRSCGNEIYAPKEGRGTEWKDLPSADWAEMMDLWHCHKPDPQPGDHVADGSDAAGSNGAYDENADIKGYGSTNRVVCTPGTAFVDVESFIFADGDCRGIKKQTSGPGGAPESRTHTPLFCEACGAKLGEGQPSLEGLKIYKSSVSILQNTKDPGLGTHDSLLWETIPVDMIAAAQLLVLIDRTGARRFVIHSADEPAHEGTLVWVFNPTLRYSSLTSSNTMPITTIEAQCAMKILYQPLSSTELQSLLNPASGTAATASLEELSLPKEIYEEVKRSLENSNSILPLSARKFREWKTGLMNVFEEAKGL